MCDKSCDKTGDKTVQHKCATKLVAKGATNMCGKTCDKNHFRRAPKVVVHRLVSARNRPSCQDISQFQVLLQLLSLTFVLVFVMGGRCVGQFLCYNFLSRSGGGLHTPDVCPLCCLRCVFHHSCGALVFAMPELETVTRSRGEPGSPSRLAQTRGGEMKQGPEPKGWGPGLRASAEGPTEGRLHKPRGLGPGSRGWLWLGARVEGLVGPSLRGD